MSTPLPGAAPEGAEAAADELRGHGHRLVDRMADYLADVHLRPVTTALTPSELQEKLSTPLPRSGSDPAGVWDDVWSRVVGEAIHFAHPMYMGHQVAPPLSQAVLADALTSLLNNSVAVREMSPSGTAVETAVVRWMIELLGFPDGADGTLVSGGSVANLTGLLAAREAAFPGAWREGLTSSGAAGRAVVLTSEHAHYSVERALGLMGMGSRAAVPLPDRDGRMDVAALVQRTRELRREGRAPFAVVATASTTATGRFDDLEAVADASAAEGLWLHVDGAHGASFLASPRLRTRLRGIERADSIAWDPHKMMFMPISAGAILVRERRHLDAAFQQSAPYLFHVLPGEERSVDIGKRTLQCSRRFDALKLWVSLRCYGLDHFAALQERTVENTRALHARLVAADDFEPCHEPEANILCFRHLPPTIRELPPAQVDAFQADLRAAYNASGRGWITATSLAGARVLRVTLMNPLTRVEHLDRLVEGLREVGERVAAVRPRERRTGSS